MRQFSSDRVDVGDAQLTVNRWDPPGTGHGVAILFAHANGFCSLMWRPVIDSMAHTPLAIAPDLRGHGASSAPPPTREHYSWERYAADLLTVADAQGVDSLHGVGHSMGAAALALAADTRPGLFRSLFLFEPIIIRPELIGAAPENPLAAQARRRRHLFESREAARERLGSKAPFLFWSPAALDLYLAHALAENEDGSVRLACDRDVEAVNYEMGSLHDGFAALGRLDIPVTLSAGSLSPVDGPIATRPLVPVLNHPRYVELAGRTHFGPFEDPAAFASEVDAHIDLVESGGFDR